MVILTSVLRGKFSAENRHRTATAKTSVPLKPILSGDQVRPGSRLIWLI